MLGSRDVSRNAVNFGTTPLKKINKGPVLQLTVRARNVEPPQGGKGMLDKTPADSGSRVYDKGSCAVWLIQHG